MGNKECIDRCIRSSFCHLEESLRLAFLALGFFRGSFDIKAVQSVLSSPPRESASEAPSSLLSRSISGSSSTSRSLFPSQAYARNFLRSSRGDTESLSSRSLGTELSTIDGHGYDTEGAMTSDSYDLLDLESSDEILARSVQGEWKSRVF